VYWFLTYSCLSLCTDSLFFFSRASNAFNVPLPFAQKRFIQQSEFFKAPLVLLVQAHWPVFHARGLSISHCIHEADVSANYPRLQYSSTEETQHQGANVNVAQPYVAAEAMPFSFKRGVDAPQSRPVAPTGESQQQDANNAQIPAVPNIFQFPSKSGARRHESRPGPVAQLGENQHQAANVAQASVPSEVFPAFLEHGAEVRESGPRPVVQKEPLQAEGPNRSSNNNMTLKILETLEDMSRPFNVSVKKLNLYWPVISLRLKP
jgi:hypothetical protein